MKISTMPAPRRAGTAKRNAERLLRVTGDDPDTLLLLIQVMDRIVARRRPRRTSSKSSRRH